jgi:hypothetical protein
MVIERQADCESGAETVWALSFHFVAVIEPFAAFTIL